jgi:hypothetical protein
MARKFRLSIIIVSCSYVSRSSGNTLAAYQAAAANVGNGTKPAGIQGGVLANSSSGSATASPSASATAKSEGLLKTQLSVVSLLFGAAAALAVVM